MTDAPDSSSTRGPSATVVIVAMIALGLLGGTCLGLQIEGAEERRRLIESGEVPKDDPKARKRPRMVGSQ